MKTLFNWIVTLVLNIFTEVVITEVGDEDKEEDSYVQGIRVLLGAHSMRSDGEHVEVEDMHAPVQQPVTWDEFTRYNQMVSKCLNKLHGKGIAS